MTTAAMTASAMESSAPMETSAEARLAAGGKVSCHSSMIKAAEGAGVRTAGGMRRSKSVLAASQASWLSAMKSASIESTPGGIEVIAIDEHSTVGDVTVVIEKNAVTMPVITPMSPPPAKAAKEAHSKTEAPCQARTLKVQPRIPIPAWPDRERISVDQPGIVLGYINHLRVGRCDHHGVPLVADCFLRCATQVAGFLRTIAHYLNSIHYVLLLIDVRIAERGGP